ncbi:hypothetical protein JCM10207_006283 [Rhodosporidiobolus poonsookiae]
MVTLTVGTQYIPPTLLFKLHGCMHHVPPLWFAELEILFQAVSNWSELRKEQQPIFLEKKKLACLRPMRMWWKQRRGTLDPVFQQQEVELVQSALDDYCERNYYGWIMLWEARTQYIDFHFAPSIPCEVWNVARYLSPKDPRLQRLFTNLPHLPLSPSEIAHIAAFDPSLGTVFEDAPPPYDPALVLAGPSQSHNCPVWWGAVDWIKKQHGLTHKQACDFANGQPKRGGMKTWVCTWRADSYD